VREGLRDYWLLNALFCPPAGSAKAASVDSDKALGIA
jgi:hypothetical protein